MLVFVSSLLLIAALTLVGRYWDPLHGDIARSRCELRSWIARGLIAPLALWVFLNLGLFKALPPIWPPVWKWHAQSGAFLPGVLLPALAGFHAVGWFWLAVTFGWVTWMIFDRVKNRRDFGVLAAAVSVVSLPIAVGIVSLGGPLYAGLAVVCWLLPVIHFTISDAQTAKAAPMYARAVARMKFGRYEDAEMEVIRQLERCETDARGWMMLAELYAERFGDLPQADKTVRELCDQPGTSPGEMSLALNKLADWHLRIGRNPDAACAALAEICRRLPETQADRMARLRIARLPVSRAELERASEEKQRVTLPPSAPRLDEPFPGIQPGLTRADAAALANDLADRLRREPDNTAAREQFAILLAEHLGRVDLAVEQLELLIDLPAQPERTVARWLGRIASWRLRLQHDEAAARGIYERLVHSFPHTPEAFEAQRRLTLAAVEERFKRAAAYREALKPVVDG